MLKKQRQGEKSDELNNKVRELSAEVKILKNLLKARYGDNNTSGSAIFKGENRQIFQYIAKMFSGSFKAPNSFHKSR
jgi:hypothetical protein